MDLPRENAIYAAHLKEAASLTAVLRGRNWQVLDDLAVRADDDARASDDGRAEAVAIITALRAAARRDEHEAPLAAPLRDADRAALNLMMQWAAKAQSRSRAGRRPRTRP